jgi:hypothetical protein
VLPPKIDERDYEKILKELREVAFSYVPELRSKDDASSALLNIFSNISCQIINRLNKVPDKNFRAFLNMFGTRLLSAQPAKVPVTFYLAEGTLESVLVPARTRVATSETEEHSAIIFETEKTMNAEVSQLKAVYSVDPADDQIFEHTSELTEGKPSELFVSSPSQEHALYLGHNYLFNLKKSTEEDSTGIKLKIGSIDGSLDVLNIIWEYWGEDAEGEKDKWKPFYKSTDERFTVLTKTDLGPIKKKEIEGKETFWIRARLDGDLPPKIPTLKPIKACIENTIRPDIAFYNDVPIDLTKSFYPFGSQPNTYDTFYIGSQGGFSKRNTNVSISFSLKELGHPEKSSAGSLLLSWEYWNGSGWRRLESVDYKFDGNDHIHPDNFKSVQFRCPQDIEPTEVNGKENYWIRIRIVSGNYGIKSANSGPYPPEINDVLIENSCEGQNLHYCFARNNLQFSEYSKTDIFKPFQPPEEKHKTIYFGFDKPFSTGRISIFFLMEKQEYLEKTKPRIEWSYLGAGNGKTEWVPLHVLDATDNLAQSGTVEFVGPSNLSKTKKFGQELYWIRAEVVEGNFQSFEKTLATFVYTKLEEARFEKIPQTQTRQLYTLSRLATVLPISLSIMLNPDTVKVLPIFTSKTERLTLSNIPSKNRIDFSQLLPMISIGSCIPEVFFHPKFTVPKEVRENPAAPIIKGIYMNTTWAIQAETVSDEILGRSDGTADPSFSFSRYPVLAESVWVREPSIPDKDFSGGKDENLVQVTDKGEVWVRWQSVEDFFESHEKSRHYMIDKSFGKIQFGNGRNGMIPPTSAIIKATYQTGGGVKGNVKAGEVSNLLTSIAFVDKVSSPGVAQGGADTEIVERALEKRPKRIQHRQRAVTREDYEWLAKEASRAVSRAKCIPNLNDEGEYKPGCVSVIIVPESNEDQPSPSSELVRMTEEYLKNRNPVSVSNLTVTSPAYISVSVTADLYVSSIDLASSVKFAAMKRLKEFLHPLYGGYDEKGWEFGKIPCLSDVLALLKELSGVDHVENLSMTIREEKSGTSSVISELKHDINLPSYVLISSGAHQIGIRWEG